jgi:hypothetical protein
MEPLYNDNLYSHGHVAELASVPYSVERQAARVAISIDSAALPPLHDDHIISSP